MSVPKWKDIAEEARELANNANDLLLDAQGGVVYDENPLEDLKDAREDLQKAARLLTKGIRILRRGK